MIRVLFSIILLLSLFATGCDSGPKTSTVKGTVTFDGKPLANAAVTFIPKSGESKAAFTNEAGVYECPGVQTGETLITVAVQEGGDEAAGKAIKDSGSAALSGKASAAPIAKPKFPPRYLDPTQSGLKLTVEDKPENKCDITLTK